MVTKKGMLFWNTHFAKFVYIVAIYCFTLWSWYVRGLELAIVGDLNILFWSSCCEFEVAFPHVLWWIQGLLSTGDLALFNCKYSSWIIFYCFCVFCVEFVYSVYSSRVILYQLAWSLFTNSFSNSVPFFLCVSVELILLLILFLICNIFVVLQLKMLTVLLSWKMVQILEVEIFMLNMLCIVLLLSNVDQKGIKVLRCWFYEMLLPVLIPLIILEDIKYNKEKKFS